MKKEFEKGLKRFLKRKVKITMGVIVSFMIMGSVSYAGDEEIIYEHPGWNAEDFQNGKTVDDNIELNGIRIWIAKEENTVINFNGHTRLVNDLPNGMDTAVIWNGASRYANNNFTINIGEGKEFYLSNSAATILQADNGEMKINGGKIVMEHANINPDIDGAYILTYSGGAITINNAESLILRKGTFVNKPESKSTSVGIGGYGKVDIGVKGDIWAETSGGLVLLGKETSVKLDAGNSIYFKSVFEKKYENYNGVGIYVDSGIKSIADVHAVNDITFETDKQGIYTLVKDNQNSDVKVVSDNGRVSFISETSAIESDAMGTTDENGKSTITLEGSSVLLKGKEFGIKALGSSKIDITSTGKNEDNRDITIISSDTNDSKESSTATIYAQSGKDNSAEVNLTSENGVVNILSNNKSVWASGDGGTININGAVNIDSRYVENGTDKLSNDGQHIAVVAGVVGEDTDLSKHGEVNITLKGDKDSLITGDIVGARDGIVNITQDNYSGRLKIKGDILAGNGRYSEEQGKQLGVVNVDLGKNGRFEGRTDDYKDLKYKNDNDSGFYDPHFSNGEVTSAGQVNINMGEDSYWNVTGQSWVTKLEGNGTIDLRGEETGGHAIHIGTLDGENKFVINLNPEDVSSGDMIFIENGTDKKQTILVSNEEDLIKLQEGQRIRFATIADAKGGFEYGGAFGDTYTIKEKGLRNVDLNVKYVDMDKEDEAEKEYTNVGTDEEYNGNKFDETKPGTDYVDDVYNKIDEDKNSQNVYFVRGENSGGGDENINDIGTTIIEMTKANYNSAVYMDNLNKRLGDMTFANGSDGVWVRMRNDRVGEDEVYRLHNYMTQVGYDKVYGMKNGNEHRGIAFEYTRGNMDYKDIQGESNIDKYMISLYDTRLYNNGAYSDIVAKVGYMESDFEIYGRETGVKATGDYDNLIFGLSGEFGKRFDFSDSYYFEPQIQLQYTYVDDTDYTTHVGDLDTKVNYGDINSLIGRAGIRLGHDFYNENSKDNTIYLKVDVNHEFLGDQDVKAVDLSGSVDKTYHNDKSWFDVGVGGAKNLTENLNVYADIERQFGEAKDNSWQFNLGFRYSFNSVKDITLSVSSLFDFDKSELKPEAKTMIQEKSKGLNNKKVKGTLNIEGHTDSIGTREYNQKLSEKRADAVTEEFKKNVTNENINYETKGYGEDRPIADNNTEDGRAKNRRVEVRYSK